MNNRKKTTKEKQKITSFGDQKKTNKTNKNDAGPPATLIGRKKSVHKEATPVDMGVAARAKGGKIAERHKKKKENVVVGFLRFVLQSVFIFVSFFFRFFLHFG